MSRVEPGQVFISWSGNHSRGIASALSTFLRRFHIPTFFSDTDIRFGTRWYDELSEEMQTSSSCIICITENSLESPWVMFEAGSISNSSKRLRVVPYVTGTSISKRIKDLPIGAFQATQSTKIATRRLMQDLCAQYSDNSFKGEPHDINAIFEMNWPELRKAIAGVKKSIEEQRMKWFCFGNACEELFAGDAIKEFSPHVVLGVNHGGAVVGGMFFTNRLDMISFDILSIHPKWQTESDNDQVQRISNLLRRMPVRPRDALKILLVDDSFKTGRSMAVAKNLTASAASAADIGPYIIKTAVITYSPGTSLNNSTHLSAPDYYVLQNFRELPYGWA